MTMSSPGGFSLGLLALVVSIQAIDYAAYRHDAIPRSVAKLTTRSLLETINDVKHRKTSYTLQEGTEWFLQYGALLRDQILDTFGKLVYERYDDFSMMEVEALHRIYQETLERKYNIFELAPAVLMDPDTRPTKICSHIHDYVHTCLKESTVVCRDIRKHDEPHPHTLSTPAREIMLHIYRSGKIAKQYPKGFSLPIVLKYLQRAKLQFTPGLLSGLLHNVRYDIFDDQVRRSERELLLYLTDSVAGKHLQERIVQPLTMVELKSVHTIGSLLKLYLRTRKTRLPAKIRRDAEFLAERIVGDVDSVNENIQLLGNVYENGGIRVDYLLGLVIPFDLVDPDIVVARDYLIRKLKSMRIVEEYLRIDKYLQASPDQLTLEIVGQLREIEFATDIATALRAHARFWHRSHMIENLNDLLELFDAYENLRRVPKYQSVMRSIDRIKENLWDSKNVSVQLLCNSPRVCLQMGLQIVMRCNHVNNETKEYIMEFWKIVTPQGSLVEDECPLPMPQNVTVRPDTRKTTIPSTIVTSKTSPPISAEMTDNPFPGMTTTVVPRDEKTVPSTLTTTPEWETSSTETETTNVPDLTPEGHPPSEEEEEEEKENLTPPDLSFEAKRIRTTTHEPDTEEDSPEVSLPTGNNRVRTSTSTPSTIDSESSTPYPLESITVTTSDPRWPSKSGACKTENCVDEGDSDETLSSVIFPTVTPSPTVGSGTTELPDLSHPPGGFVTHPDGNCSGEDCDRVCEEGEDCSTGQQCIGENCPRKNCEEGEDCSSESRCVGENCPRKTCEEGEDCSAIDCSGENCPRKTSEECSEEEPDCQEGDISTEVVVKCDPNEASCVSSTDCTGDECSSPSPPVFTTDIEDDCSEGRCMPEIGDKLENCDGEDCNKSPTDNPKAGSCQGKDCPPYGGVSCEGSECSTEESEISTSTEPSKNTNDSSVYCDNKDPNYQKKLSKLQKMMKISALRAAELLAARNSSQESNSEERTRRTNIGSTSKDYDVSDDKPYEISVVRKPHEKRIKMSNGMEVYKVLGQPKKVKYRPSPESEELISIEQSRPKKPSSYKQKIYIEKTTDSSGSGSASVYMHPNIHIVKKKKNKSGSGKRKERVQKIVKISTLPAGKPGDRSTEEIYIKKSKHRTKPSVMKILLRDQAGKVRGAKPGSMTKHGERTAEEYLQTSNANAEDRFVRKKHGQHRRRPIVYRLQEPLKDTPAVYQIQTEKPIPTRSSRSILRRPPRRDSRFRT